MSVGETSASASALGKQVAPPELEFWPADGAPSGELEEAFGAWSTAHQIMELQQNLKDHKPVVREALCGRLLAAKLAALPDQRAQLDGLKSRPELNSVEVELLGAAGADGRFPVRVRSDKSEIRVYMARLRPPRKIVGKTEKWLRDDGTKSTKAKKKKERQVAAGGRKTTELSLELAKRRDILLGTADNLELTPQHLTDHLNYINAQAEKLQVVAVAIRKRYAITVGLYKTTKDPDKVLQLRNKEETIRAQEDAYNANVEYLRDEQKWLSNQPAMKKMLKNMRDTMVQRVDGKWVEKPPDPEEEEELSFEDLLQQMKMEDATAKAIS